MTDIDNDCDKDFIKNIYYKNISRNIHTYKLYFIASIAIIFKN